MKKTYKAISIAVLASLIAGTSLAGLSACGEKEQVKLPDYEYDYSTPVEDFGDGIDIDGKLNESHWQEGRALSASIRNTTAEYRMMSYYGAEGVYFAFEVKDDAVYYNAAREIWANSGIEFCVGSPSNLRITYEIDLNAGGKRMLRKFVGTGGTVYMNWFSDLHSAIFVNGEINGDCEGYSAEIYLPYHLFNDDNSDTAVDSLLVNPAIIRASSSDATNTDRLWYSIGEQERGLGWAPAQSNWYSFKKDVGLVASTVTLNAGEHGRLTGSDYVIPGDKYTVTVRPDEGYYLEKLLFDGLDVTDALEYFNGVASYTGTALGALQVDAQFAALPTAVHTLSGKVTASGALNGLKMYAVYSGAYREITVGSDGTYSVQLPETEWKVYCTADGYLNAIETVDLIEDTVLNFTLTGDYLEADNPAIWNFEELGVGSAYAVQADWLTGALHRDMSGTKVFASGNIVAKMASDDVRVGFVFETSLGVRIFVSLMAGKNNLYGIQIITSRPGEDASWGEWNAPDVNLEEVVGSEVRQLASGNGVPMAVLYDAGKLSIWVNGTSVFRDVECNKAAERGINAETTVRPGIMVCSKDTAFHNLTFNTTGFDNGYPINITKTGKGTITVEGEKDTFTPGQPVVFHITPGEGYMVTAVTVNGKDRLSDLVGNTLTVQTDSSLAMVSLDVLFTRVVSENNTFSGTVKANGTPIAGIEVRLYDAAQKRTYSEITDADGKFLFSNLPAGTYRLTVNARTAQDGAPSEHYQKQYITLDEEYIINGTESRELAIRTVTKADLYIESGATEFFDVESLPEVEIEYEGDVPVIRELTGGTIRYTYSGAAVADDYHEISTQFRADAGEDFFVSANFRKQDSFDLALNLRYGFIVRNGGWWLGFTIIREPGGMQIQVFNWDAEVWNGYSFTQEDVAAWESETGLTYALARVNDVYYIYLLKGETWVNVFSVQDYAKQDAGRPIRLAIAAWEPAKGAELRSFSWKRGEVGEFTVEKSGEGVTVETDKEKYHLGDDIILTFTPEEGMSPESVLVNGVQKVSELQQAEGVYTLTLRGYVEKTALTVQAKFADLNILPTVTLTVNLHRFGVGENNRTVISNGTKVVINGTRRFETTAQGGKAVFASIPAGEYAVQVEGYVDKTVEFTAAATETEVLLEYRLVAENVGDNLGNIDFTNINDGKFTYEFTSEGTSESHFKTIWHTTGDFFLYTKLKKGDRFVMQDLRYGFSLYGGAFLHITLVSDGSNLSVAANNWGNVEYLQGLSSEIKTAWESEGIGFAVARRNGILFAFVEREGVYTQVLSFYREEYAKADLSMGFGVWSKAQGAEFTDIAYEERLPQAVESALSVRVEQDTITGATLVVSPAAPLRGDDITLLFTPQEGYFPSMLQINGEDKLSLLSRNAEGKYEAVLTQYNQDSLTIEASFAAGETVEVSFKLKLHKFGIGTDSNYKEVDAQTDVRLVADGGADLLANSVTEGGIVTFHGVKKGNYTLLVEHFKGYAVNVTEEISQQEVTLEYDFIKTPVDSIHAENINDGTVTISKGSSQTAWFTQEVKGGEDFYLSAVIKNMAIGGGDARIGFKVGWDLDGNDNGGLWDDMWDSASEVITEAMLLKPDSNAEVQFPGHFSDDYCYKMTAEEAQALCGETGFLMGFARVNGQFYLYVAKGGSYFIVPFNDNGNNVPALRNSSLRVGIFNEHNQAENTVATLASLRYEIVVKGQKSSDPALAAAFTEVEVMAVTNDVSVFKYPVNNGVVLNGMLTGRTDGDYSNFSSQNGSVKWATPTNEIVFFKRGMKSLTIDYTVKALSFPAESRITLFALYFGEGPFVVDVCETGGEYSLRMETHWGFWGSWDSEGNEIKLTAQQKEALFGQGLKVRVVRGGNHNFQFDLYLAEGAGQEVGTQPVKSRDFTKTDASWDLGTVGCGLGVNNASAEFTGITLSNVVY